MQANHSNVPPTTYTQNLPAGNYANTESALPNGFSDSLSINYQDQKTFSEIQVPYSDSSDKFNYGFSAGQCDDSSYSSSPVDYRQYSATQANIKQNYKEEFPSNATVPNVFTFKQDSKPSTKPTVSPLTALHQHVVNNTNPQEQQQKQNPHQSYHNPEHFASHQQQYQQHNKYPQEYQQENCRLAPHNRAMYMQDTAASYDAR